MAADGPGCDLQQKNSYFFCNFNDLTNDQELASSAAADMSEPIFETIRAANVSSRRRRVHL